MGIRNHRIREEDLVITAVDATKPPTASPIPLLFLRLLSLLQLRLRVDFVRSRAIHQRPKVLLPAALK